MVIVMMWLVLYDVNYIYRRMTPRFVDYDEVEAGKIKQNVLPPPPWSGGKSFAQNLEEENKAKVINPHTLI